MNGKYTNPKDRGVDWDCIHAVARECKAIADKITFTFTLPAPIDWFAIGVWYELTSTWLKEAPNHPFGDFSAEGRQLMTSLLEETVRAITSVAEICRSPNPLDKSRTEERVAWAALTQSVMMQSMSPRKDVEIASARIKELVEANTLILNALRDASDTQERSRTPRLRGRLLRRELAEAIGKKDPRDNHFGRQLDRLADFGLIDRPATPGRGSNGYAITSMGRAALTFFESALSAPPKA